MVLNFGLTSSNLFRQTDENGDGLTPVQEVVIRNQAGGSTGVIPIGAIVAWAKSLSGAPDLLSTYVECNGQTLNDTESPLNGATIPDLNTTKRFIRGHTSSGATGGSDTHTHANGGTVADGAGGGTAWDGSQASAAGSSLPAYMEMVWIMRIK